LTTVPFPDGAAQVWHVGLDGTVEVVWTGLTTVVDVAVGDDGTLYALELSTGNLTEPPFLTAGSGRIVRQTGPDSSEVVVEGLMFPIAMELGPDGAFYVSIPAIGANDGSGAIVRIDPSGAAPTASAPTGSCTPIEGTTGTMPPPPPTATTPASEATVTIESFAFGPAELSVAAGTPVTFVNNDTAPHTATADAFDTGRLDLGESATITLDEPGSHHYLCTYHPNMIGTITVT
jgi:plastocyanin